MNDTTRIRVLIHCRGAGADLFRTLVSLACQTIGPKRLNIALASTAPAEHTTAEARLLHGALNFRSIELLDATSLHPAQALNIAALEGSEEWLVLVPEGTRLSPRFMARCMEAGRGQNVQGVYCSHTAGSPDSIPLARSRPFSPEQLVRMNPVGPASLVRREAWEKLGGLRIDTRLVMWDFWLRLALAHGRIIRVPDLLAFCRPLPQLSPWQDGKAKALLVVGMPGAFEPDVCRWAVALLRGDTWALPFEPGRIPAPRDVQAMFAGVPASIRPEHPAWSAKRSHTA